MSTSFRRLLPVLIVLAAVVLVWRPKSQLPPERISRAKLDRLISMNGIAAADLTPRNFPGIYQVQGSYITGPDQQKVRFEITTHLNHSQVDALLSRHGVSIEVPKISTQSKIMD